MICRRSNPSPRRPSGAGRRPRGFTLVELMVVMLVLAVLIALLLPALNGALRTSRNAAVGSEINQLAQALNAFKAKYGDYPPSRVYLPENGFFPVTSTQSAHHLGRVGRHHRGAACPAVRCGDVQVFPERELQYFGSGVRHEFSTVVRL